MPRVSTFTRANAVHNPKVVELDAILDDIKSGRWEKQINDLRKLEGAAFQERKKLLMGFTASGVFSERNDAGLEELSGVIQCDIDFKDNPGRKLSEIRAAVIEHPSVYAAFRSPSGKGIKALIKCKPDKNLHAGSHTAAVHYFADRGIVVDDRVCALSQLCFVSFDSGLYVNKGAKTITPVEVDESVEATLIEFEEPRTDEQILTACEEAWPDVFSDLWAGEVDGDHSAADHHLIAILRENCFSNSRVVELFEQSGLYRPEKHKNRTHDYVMRSLAKCSAVKSLSMLEVIPEDPEDPSPPRKKRKGAWSWQTAAEIPDWKAEDDKYIIKRLLYEGTVVCIFGAPGSGKTFCLFSMAAAITTGIEWQGHKVKRGAVMYMGMEGYEGVTKRIQAMKKEGHLTEDAAKLFARVECKKEAMNLMCEEHVTKASNMVKAFEEECGYKVKLLIIDTLARATPGGDENSTKDMGVAVNNSQAIADRTGCAVLLVHHSGKDSSKGPRGSSALPAAFDSTYEVFKLEDEPSVRVFRVKKQRDQSDTTDLFFKLQIVELGLDLDLEPETSCLVRFLGAGEIPVKKEKGQVDADTLLHLIPVEGATLAELANSTGISRTTLKKRLLLLTGDGTLTTDKAGRYVRPEDPLYDPTIEFNL